MTVRPLASLSPLFAIAPRGSAAHDESSMQSIGRGSCATPRARPVTSWP
jgi:hypothetical protein